MQHRIHVLAELPGAMVLSKPAEASWKTVRAFLNNQGTGLAQRFQPQRGVFPVGASGALLVKARNSPALADYADLYVALLRGTVPNSNVTLRSRLCQPSEGSNAWRLAGLRTEGLEASTVLRPVAYGHLAGTAATLALLRPLLRASDQQLLLHCAAAGCPVLGDRLHNGERRLDFRFEDAESPTKRLMLHCLRVKVAGTEVLAPQEITSELEVQQELADFSVAADELMNVQNSKPVSEWDTFAGGLPSQIVDDTCWDRRLARGNEAMPHQAAWQS
ncbi:unnamed protein product [Cladocopium goreaui]|uniref:Uncharacterized protein n=1 Tax=Cladocopium goreaui TaxID=2562237 RepID=A0A9P1BSW4_9DINO|nr:unnamed protein product [Cladocopium goreaui]